MNAIVGYSGFVGSNLYTPDRFQAAFNSKNIEEAYGLKPDILVYAGVRAEKYLANHDPQKDLQNIKQAESNIERIQPKKLVLISTIDVFKTPIGVDETAPIETNSLHAYGYNRFLLEQWVRSNFPDALILRLPGLFGKNLKKNFIYDYIHVIPSMLNDAKFLELNKKDHRLQQYYMPLENGFWKVTASENDRPMLKKIFFEIGFSALNFTDSRSKFQFYNLERLWNDIQIALKNDIHLLHLATEPISVADIYRYLSGKEFINELEWAPAYYDYKTIYDSSFGRKDGYICDQVTILREIKNFVKVAQLQ